jgi:hypothetical protein
MFRVLIGYLSCLNKLKLVVVAERKVSRWIIGLL